jgi:uncharacterized protein (TIGR03437 family)
VINWKLPPTEGPWRPTLRSALSLAFLFIVPLSAQNPRPVIRYANILGGSGSDTPTAVAVDAGGNLYITGRTTSRDFPYAKRLSTSHDASGGDVFVVKIDPSGASLVYSVIIGSATPVAIAVDSSGNAYVAGLDPATDFPTTKNAIATTGRCFLSKLAADGSTLVWSTVLPCNGATSMYQGGLTVDAAGNSHLTGYSGSISTTPGAFRTTGFGPFAMKINATGSALVYSTYLPGTANYASAMPYAVAADAAGNAYITGTANAKGFPASFTIAPASDPTTDEAFVLKLSPDGSKILFSTLIGGIGSQALAIAPQADGSSYIAGAPAFLAKLTPGGDALAFGTSLPMTGEAYCLSATDRGIDVLTFDRVRQDPYDLDVNRLLRISSDGKSVLNSSIVSNMTLPFCGQSGGTFALAADTSQLAQVVTVSPNLKPIGPAQKASVWFSAVSADVPGAQRLDLDSGELQLFAWPARDGSFPGVTRAIHAETGNQSVPLGVFGGRFVTAKAAQTATPGDILITAPWGTYTDRVDIFAPGVQDGLVIVPVKMTGTLPQFAVQPLDHGRVRLSATGPDAPPVSATVVVSSSVATDIFGTQIAAPLNFTVTTGNSQLAPWLHVDPVSGTTPAQIRITANPAGLNNFATYGGSIGLLGPNEPLGAGASVIASIGVTLSIGPAFQAPYLIIDPASLSFRLDADHPSGSATVHVTSPFPYPISFTVDTTPAWLEFKPSSGTTPIDITATANPGMLSSGWSSAVVGFRMAPGGASLGGLPVTLAQTTPDYIGVLNAQTLSGVSNSTGPLFAPGGLFYIDPNSLLETDTTASADPGSLASSLAGYSFKLNGVTTPLRSCAGHIFVAQVPWEVAPGTYTLDAYDASGRHIATGQIKVDALAPVYDTITETDSLPRARKVDGLIVDGTNPVRPGELILLKLTGQGSVNPPIPDGSASPRGVTSTPLSQVTAIIAGKPAVVHSAAMNTTEAGVLDVWLEVPDVADGDYTASVSIAGLNAGGSGVLYCASSCGIALRVRAANPGPLIGYGGVVNSGSLVPQIAPGSLFSIYGSGLASTAQGAPSVPLPLNIGQTSVSIGGKHAPLFYVAAGQINAQAPYELVNDAAAPVVVTVNGVSSAVATVSVVSTAPGILQFGVNRAVVQDEDLSTNDVNNGAAPGSIIIAYLTGAGALDNPVGTGEPAPVAPLSRPQGPVTATINGLSAEVGFGGLTPGLIGVMQVNARVPNLPAGTYPLVVSIGGVPSNSALVTVKSPAGQ